MLCFVLIFAGTEAHKNDPPRGIQRRLGKNLSVGLGYNFYGMKLTSHDSDVNGYLKVRHHGPAAFFTVGY